jgi:protein O-mannosyl-transferase
LTITATKRAAAPDDSAGLFASESKRRLIFALLIVAATLAIYNPVNSHPFVNYDDDRYVTENPHVHAGLSWDTVRWAFTSTEQANWHPLTWISHELDCQLFGLNPAGHHFTSLLIHAMNAALLFLLLVWGTRRTIPSLFVALMFALHPIAVESVAWVAERKNVLSTFFFLLTLAAYGWYARKPNWQRYFAVTALFACSLMSKPMAVTLPFVLLLLDYWPLGRIAGGAGGPLEVSQSRLSSLILEKVPLLGLSAVSSLITLHAQRAGGAIRSAMTYPLSLRVESAVVAYGMYLWKMIWPARLAPLYPYAGDSLSAWWVAVALVLLVGASIVMVRAKGFYLVGWLWFLGTLVPVIGLLQVGDAAMADRYAYIPLIGIFVIVAFAFDQLADRLKMRAMWRAIFALCVVALFGLVTIKQLSYWRTNYGLWSHTVAVTGPNFIAQDNLGGALVLMGKVDEAYPHFLLASEINPRDPMSHSNLGAYLQEHGQRQEAMQEYQIAIRLTSDRGLLASTYANLGSDYAELGDDDNALMSFDEALRLNPLQFNAYAGLGALSQKRGNMAEAIKDYARAVEIMPTPQGYFQLGQALQKNSQTPQAIDAYQQALKMAPGMQEAQEALHALSGGR